MYQITLSIDGMACGMCESHVCDTIRSKFSVKKVTSSHSKGKAVVLSEEPLDETVLRAAIHDTGYELQSVSAHPCEKKKGLFGFLKK